MRQLLAAAFVLVAVFGSVETAMAQPITEPQTFQVFPRSNRQAQTYESASAVIPEGVQNVLIRDLMSDADASDPTNEALITVLVSFDGGQTYTAQETMQWQGGTHFDKRTGTFVPNHIEWGVGVNFAWTGHRAKLRIDLPARLQIGLTLTVNPDLLLP